MGHHRIAPLFGLPSIHWFAGVHFQPYEHEILVIDSLRANTVLLIELEVFCYTHCETIFVMQLFCALQGIILCIEHV